MNPPRRVMIVDDERLVIDGISLTIRRDLGPGFEVCGSASSGKEAIAAIASCSPDIVLMDVSMPGISGLEAMRETLSRGAGAVYILVTAYERFDVVRDALRLGAFDYLLKPVKKEVLRQSLLDAAQELSRREAAERAAIECRVLSEAARRLAGEALLRGLALEEADGSEREGQLQALAMKEGRWMAVAAAFLPTPGSPMPEAETEALRIAWGRALKFRTRALSGPAPRGGGIALLPLEGETEAGKEEIRAAIKASMSADMEGGRLRMGFGSPRKAAELLVSWREALADLSGRSADTRATSREEEAETFFTQSDEAIRALAASAQEAGLSFDRLFSAQSAHPARLAAVLGSAAIQLQARGMLGQAEALGFTDSIHALFSHGSGAASGRDILERILKTVEYRAEWSLPVARAMSFIKEAYGRQISLEQVAARAGVSAGRLSRLLAEETGRGFSEILIETRIQRSKELLSRLNASVKDVSIAVGYPDSSYFARLFRKMTGLSPSAWAEEAQGGQGTRT